MDTLLWVLGLVLLLVFCLGALLSLLIGVPGTFLILAAAFAYAWATGFAAVGWATIGWLGALALLGEGIEFFAATAGAASTRPSRRVTAAVLAGGLVGGLAGTPFLFGVGSLLGALLGAFAGAVLAVAWEGGTFDHALRTGLAAMRGRLLGFVVKASIAVLMVVLLFAAAL